MRPWLIPLSLSAFLGLSVLLAGAAQAQSQSSLLHDALHLSAAQEDAWRAYQRSVASDPQEQARTRQTGMLLPTLPTPRRLALIRAQMDADLVAFDRKARATEGFYAALAPDQQRTFDRQTATSGGPPQ